MQFFKRTTALYDNQLEQIAARAEKATLLLQQMLEHPDQAQDYASRLSDLEREADRVVRETFALSPHQLGSARYEELLLLVERVDDVVDVAHETGQILWLHRAGTATDHARALTEIFVKSTREVRRVLTTLRNLGSPKDVLDINIEINRLENESDERFRQAMLDLFSGEHEALQVVRWKDVYEMLELGVDRCQEVARLAEGLQQASA